MAGRNSTVGRAVAQNIARRASAVRWLNAQAPATCRGGQAHGRRRCGFLRPVTRSVRHAGEFMGRYPAAQQSSSGVVAPQHGVALARCTAAAACLAGGPHACVHFAGGVCCCFGTSAALLRVLAFFCSLLFLKGSTTPPQAQNWATLVARRRASSLTRSFHGLRLPHSPSWWFAFYKRVSASTLTSYRACLSCATFSYEELVRKPRLPLHALAMGFEK